MTEGWAGCAAAATRRNSAGGRTSVPPCSSPAAATATAAPAPLGKGRSRRGGGGGGGITRVSPAPSSTTAVGRLALRCASSCATSAASAAAKVLVPVRATAVPVVSVEGVRCRPADPRAPLSVVPSLKSVSVRRKVPVPAAAVEAGHAAPSVRAWPASHALA